MFYLMAAFCVGPILLYCYGELLPSFVYILFSFCCLSLIKSRYFLPGCCFLIGMLYFSLEVLEQQANRLDEGLLEQPLNIEVYLCSVPTVYAQYSRAHFCLNSQTLENKKLGISRVMLNWSEAIGIDLERPHLRLKVELKHPRATFNSVGGAYEKYMFYRRVSAVGKVLGIDSSKPSSQELTYSEYLRYYLVQRRLELSRALDQMLIGLEHGGLIKALLNGERGAITASDSRILRNTGTQHLLAISGLHVGIVTFFLFRMLPRSTSSNLLIILSGLVYVVMVGFGESAQRAWIMSILALAFLSGKWQPSLARVYLIALFLVLLFDPLAPMNIGFWYSFSCVALLMLLSSFSPHKQVGLGELLLVQLVLIFGMAPLSATMGTYQGLASLFANLIAVPWVSLLVLPFSLIALVVSTLSESWAVSMFACIDVALQILMQYLLSLRALGGEFLLGGNALNLCAYLIVLICSLLIIQQRAFNALMFLVLLVVLFYPSSLRDGSSEFIVFDAGQGLAIAMVWADQYWLYDTGPQFGSYAVSESAIYPYLRWREVLPNISGLLVSHGDADHAGDVESLDRYLRPEVVLSGEPKRLPLTKPLEACLAGMSFGFQGASIEVLYPFGKELPEKVSSNNHSCVIRFSFKGHTFLLVGDLEGEAEMQLVARYRNHLKADVLIAGHHGSANASSIALLKHVRPRYLIASAGYRNRFGHPHEDVKTRASNLGIELLSTADYGAISFILDGELGLSLSRCEHSAYWLDKCESKGPRSVAAGEQ